MMLSRKEWYKSGGRESGFSLVELMVALLIGLIILLGAGQLFLMSKRSYDQADRLASRQQAVRSIFDIISLDIRTAQDVADNSSDQAILLLSYSDGARNNDPYCASSSEKLNQVKYTFDSEDNALFVAVGCGSTVDVSSSKGEELISNIESLSFILSEDHFFVNSEDDEEFRPERGLAIEIDVTFPPVAEEEEDSRRNFVFKVARRGNIL